MSQQLNLFSEHRRAMDPVLVALVIWGAVILVLVATWGVNQIRLKSAEESAASTAKRLDEARSVIRQRDDAKAAIELQIANLAPQAAAAKKLLNLADALGNTQGYSEYLTSMAAATESELWLTGVGITKAGRAVSIGGNALSNDSILRYSRKLNEAFSDRKIQFTSIEMTPLAVGANKDGQPPALVFTKFIIH